MKIPLYRQAIQHGWRVAWQNKFLWVYGLFAAFLGQMGIVEFLSKAGLVVGDVNDYLSTVGLIPTKAVEASTVIALSAESRVLMFWLLFLLIGLAAALIFASVVSQGAIVHAAAKATKSKKTMPDVGAAWHAGVSHFWRLFTLNLVKKVAIVLLAIAVGGAAFNAVVGSSLGSNILFLVVFLLASLVGLVLSFLVVYAAGYVVVEEYPLVQAIESAWKLFWSHWLVSFEVGLLILLFNGILFCLTLLGFLVFFFPAMLVWFAAIVLGSQALLAMGFIIALILFTGYVMLLGAAFTVFSTSVWTHLFMKMHKSGVKSRVLHWLSYKRA